MTIELNDKSYIVGLWFSSSLFHRHDWLAWIIKDPENPKGYTGGYRFRYAKDNKIFDSEDEKSWRYFKTTEEKTEDEIIKIGNDMQEKMKAHFPQTDKIIVKGNLEKLMELAKDKPWMHLQTEKLH